MRYQFLRCLFVLLCSLAYSEGWPIFKLWGRQELTLDVCAQQKAVPDANCWNLANIPDYLNNPTTGWIAQHTTSCEDSTKCCIPDDDGWTTCFLRLALPASGQDCTTLNDHPCTSQADLDPNLAASIVPQVRYTVLSIYGVHDFFSTYFTSLNMAYAQALATITDITLLLDPNKTTQISLFAILSALSVALAFLTAPTVAASMLTLATTAKYAAQSFALSLAQAPGVTRAVWPAGDDLSRTYQIGQLQEKVSNISVELGNRLQAGLHLIMTDPSTFATFADNGRYSNNDPPLDPNEVKNDLAVILQTYLVSESMKQNNWYATPLKISTKEEYDARQDPACMPNLHGLCPGQGSRESIYWSPASSRQYKLSQKDPGQTDPSTVLKQITQWANLPLLFDGGYNCTALGQRDNPQLVHVNYDGTLDVACISQLPIEIPCDTTCPQPAADGTCPFPPNADCNPPNQGGDTVRQGNGAGVVNLPQSPPRAPSADDKPFVQGGMVQIHRR